MGFSAVFEVCSAERLVANGVCGRIRKSSPPAFSDRQPSQFFLECFYGLDLDRLSQDGTLVTLLELFPSQDPQVRRNRRGSIRDGVNALPILVKIGPPENRNFGAFLPSISTAGLLSYRAWPFRSQYNLVEADVTSSGS